jgi:chromosome segregation ATPase
LQSKLADRDKVTDKEECPVCGSRLDSEEARARLHYERSCWEDDLAKLEDQKAKHSQQLTLNQQAKREAQNKLATAGQATRNADKELARAQSDFDNAQSDVLHAQKALHEARQQTGTWVTQLDVLDTLEAEFDDLKISSEDWRKLGTAKQMESATQATISTCQAQLDDRPKWSDEERQHLQSEAAKSAATVTDYQRDKETAQTEANATKSHREDLEKQQQKLETDLHVAQNKLEDLNKRRLQAEQEVERYQKALPQAWANHPACEDEIALEKLKGEFAKLSDAETEENRLHEAQARANELAGGIKILQSQLEAIPANHRRSVPEIEAELESAREKVKQ